MTEDDEVGRRHIDRDAVIYLAEAGRRTGMRLLLGRQMVLLAQVVRPIYGVALSIPQAIRRRKQSAWNLVEGTIERVSVLVPDGFPEPYRWTVELTFSYRQKGEYFSGAERRAFLNRREADEFLAILGNRSTADAVSDKAGNDRVETLGLGASMNNIDVLVCPDRPERAIVAGFLENAQVLSAHVRAPMRTRSSL